jgi:hypothetical protein
MLNFRSRSPDGNSAATEGVLLHFDNVEQYLMARFVLLAPFIRFYAYNATSPIRNVEGKPLWWL